VSTHVLQSLINRMEVMVDGAYRVEHDQSKNLLAYHGLLKRFIDHDREIEFRQTEIASLKFPLKLAEVTPVDSKTSPAVQLADVMIGAAIEAANNMTGLRSSGLDPEAVMLLYADHQFIHLIPSLDFEEQRRFRQGTQASELHENVLRKWVKEFGADPVQAFPGHRQMKPEQQEIERLRREVHKLNAERDILKKAAAFFAKEAT
jgi:hypothetical protein